MSTELHTYSKLPNGELVKQTPAELAFGVPACYEHDTLVKRVKGSSDTRVRVRYFYITRDAEVGHYEEWLTRLPLRGKYKEIGWDTETSGLNAIHDKVATEQIGNPMCDDPRVYIADMRCLSPEAAKRFLAPINDPGYLKVGQNIGFECKFGMRHFKLRPQRLYCTQITELVIRAGLLEGGRGSSRPTGDEGGNRRAYGQTSMAKNTRRYCGAVELDKDTELRTSFYKTEPGKHQPRQIIYAGSDCVHPFWIKEGQLPEIQARVLRSVLAVEYDLIPVLADMELRGMAFNSEAWIKLWQVAVIKHEQAEKKLDDLFLGVEPDLFAGTGAADSPRKVCSDCLGEGVRYVGESRRKRGVECETCSGTGRIGGGIRPLYTGGKGKNAKPQPLNWGSPPQVKWAIRQYCAKTQWGHTLITTPGQLQKAKRQFGGEWAVKKGLIKFDAEGNPNTTMDKLPNEVIDEIPDYLIPEATHCILLKSDADTIALRMYYGQLPKNLCELLLEYGEQKARLGTFGRKFLNHVDIDGRIRFEFHQAIASTGRLSASPNSMNIPREVEYRYCFIAAPGKRLCIADYSQQEPRTSAYVSRDSLFMKNYAEDGDLYITVAEAMLGYRPNPKAAHGPDGKPDPKATPDVVEFEKKSKDDRQAIKSTSLGLNYRMGAGKLRNKLTLDTKRPWTFFEAADLHRGYLERCSGIKDYQEMCEQLADPNNPKAVRIWDILLDAPVTFIESPCGRKRFFPPDAKNVYTEACNHPIQGCGATMTKAAMVLIYREIAKRGWQDKAYLVNAIHDELIMEADEDIAVECAAMMKAMMEKAGAYYIKDVKIVASFPTPDGTSDKWVKD